MANYTAGDSEVTAITAYISSMFGAPVVNVELVDSQYVNTFNTAIEEYSSYITQWAIRSNIANALGLDSATDFTQRWVAQNFEFAQSFAKAYSEQANVGGEVPIYKDSFILEAGKQTYYFPPDIEINEILWQEPAAITRYLVDPNNNPAWVNFEFGWGYMGHSYMYIVPAHFTIQLANATKMRWKIWRGDYTYTIRPAGADSGRTDLPGDYSGQTHNAVAIYPVPKEGAVGTRVWYFYKKKAEMNLYSLQDLGSVVNNPGTIQMDEIPYSAFNSSSQRWVKQYTYALCKEVLGNIRSKFSEMPIPDATITMDGELLRSEGQEAQAKLKEHLFNELEAMSIGTLIEGQANSAEILNKQLSYNPMGIYLG